MKIVVNVDGLRTISGLAVNASEKMEQTNGVISTVVSNHEWKCPERESIDQLLERIKENSIVLKNAIIDFSNQITDIANDYTGYLNDQGRFETTYLDDVGALLARLSSNARPSGVVGTNTRSVMSSMAAVSMNTENIASLHGASHGISIMDFSLFRE